MMDAMEENKSKLVEGSYCRAWGKLKSFHDRKHVGAQIIRPVEDFNEISYHLLEATVVHLYHTRGPLGATTGSGDAAANGGQDQQQAAGGTYGGADLSGYSQAAKRVFKYLSEAPQTNEGLHLTAIATELDLNPGEVAKAGDDLLSGGLIYTTVDDQTWAVLEAD